MMLDTAEANLEKLRNLKGTKGKKAQALVEDIGDGRTVGVCDRSLHGSRVFTDVQWVIDCRNERIDWDAINEAMERLP